MAYQFEQGDPSAYPIAGDYPYVYVEPGSFDGAAESAPDEFDAEEQAARAEPIDLVKIKTEQVVRALINGAIQRIEAEAEEDDEVPVEMSLEQVRGLLADLRKQFPAKADQAALVLDDLHIDGVPSLPGFKPFARVIPTETIEALDDRYGGGFVEGSLAKLIEQRDRKALAGTTMGQAAVGELVETVGEEAGTAEQDPKADTPQNEYAHRLRDGQLYVGDIPFPHWYKLLHDEAVRFIQQQRQEGRTDLRDARPMRPEKLAEIEEAYLYLADHPDELPLIVRTKNGLPLFTTDDADIDIAGVNNCVIYELGYPQNQNFVYHALLPALNRAPRILGSLHDRKQPPAPEMPDEHEKRLEQLLRIAATISSSPDLHPGDESEPPAGAFTDTTTLEHAALVSSQALSAPIDYETALTVKLGQPEDSDVIPVDSEVNTSQPMSEYEELKAYWATLPLHWRLINRGLYWVVAKSWLGKAAGSTD